MGTAKKQECQRKRTCDEERKSPLPGEREGKNEKKNKHYIDKEGTGKKMNKKQRKRKGILRAILCSVAVLLAAAGMGDVAYAYTNLDVPGVDFAPEGGAWTVIDPLPTDNDPDPENASYWVTSGQEKTTGIALNILQPGVGQHAYHYERHKENTMTPIYKWVCSHKTAMCIHEEVYSGGGDDYDYYGIPRTDNTCRKEYWSGWIPYCADCGQIAGYVFHYISPDKVSQIQYIDLAHDYYYKCPHCNELEQANLYEHDCRAISYNQYIVKYKKNANGARGEMGESYHTYNNATMIDGNEVVPETRLRKNTFTWTGYEFDYWSTNPDGTGERFEDEQEIYNLTAEHYDENLSDFTGEGIITLYAQWKESISTLIVDADGGVYNDPDGVEGITVDVTGTISGDITTYAEVPYGGRLALDEDKLTAPWGYKVSFDTHGGEEIEPIQKRKELAAWKTVGTLKGKFRNDMYYFMGPDGSVDTIKATYQQAKITLPDAENGDKELVGWYLDLSFTKYVGLPGDPYTPPSDVTLHAKWADGLILYSETDLAVPDNTYKGGVDLEWNSAIVTDRFYKVFQKKTDESADDYKVVTSTGSVEDVLEVKKNISYSGTAGNYTIPHNGYYMFTGYGAQGANYSDGSLSYTGGKGGSAQVKMYFDAGDIINYSVGGQNGYLNGGEGDPYGNGGGSTRVTYRKKDGSTGTVLVAGGGGAACKAGNGGAGGAEINLVASGGAGEDGVAGGGAGYVGGMAGAYEVHNCTDECYVTSDYTASYSFYEHASSAIGGTFFVAGNELVNNPLTYSSNYAHVGAHHTNAAHPHSITSIPISTDGKGTLTFKTYKDSFSGTEAESGGYTRFTEGVNYYVITVKNTSTGEILYQKDAMASSTGHTATSYQETFYCANGASCFYPTHKYRDHVKWSINDVENNADGTLKGSISGYFDAGMRYSTWHDESGWRGSPATLKSEITCTVNVPEGVDFVTIEVTALEADKLYTSLGIKDVTYTGREKVCGYEDGEIISCSVAYGGSSYVNEDSLFAEKKEGVRTGNGYLKIESVDIGFMVSLEMQDVNAPDLAAPEKVDEDTVKKMSADAGENVIKVSWDRPEDNGTAYNHVVKSYVASSGNEALTSNEVENLIKQGVTRYLFLYNSVPAVTLTPGTAGVAILNNSSSAVAYNLTKPDVGDVKYLHIAPVDRAGNVGETIHVKIEGEPPVPDDIIRWEVETEGINISSVIGARDYKSVYTSPSSITYVKADGRTPFKLEYDSKMLGDASADYQIDNLMFKVEAGVSLSQTFTTTATHTSVTDAGRVDVATAELRRSVSGDTLFRDAMNSYVYRENRATAATIGQAFAIPASKSGTKFKVTPGVGASYTAEDGWMDIKMSDAARDALNAIEVVADGEAPVIEGMDIFDILTDAELAAGYVAEFKATDALSGVGSFEIEVLNKDNMGTGTYVADASGKIRITLDSARSLFNGDFTVKAIAVDNVGNKSVIEKDMAGLTLTASVRKAINNGLTTYAVGEGAILDITTTGYAEKVRIIWPANFTGVPTEFDYTSNPEFTKIEAVPFVVPAGSSEYTITVEAIKGGRVLSEDITIQVFGVKRGYVRIR